MSDAVDVSIVMPCLNEAETLATCVQKAMTGLQAAGVTGEVIVADNGSTDESVAIAARQGARVVAVAAPGYGNALRGGIEAARGRWIIMGDADDSYDFSKIDGFVAGLASGADLVMGCRMPRGGGRIMPGAMPWKNRWIGNPILSAIGRLFFRCPVQDFHCGLRGFSRNAYDRMALTTTGMEFASEMVIKAQLKSMRMVDVPIRLHKDGRSRPPHLKPWRDGWRHLRFMLLFAPRWLFLLPGLMLLVLGGGLSAVLSVRNLTVAGVHLEIGTLVIACITTVVGFQLTAFAFYTQVFAIGEGLLPQDERLSRLFRIFNLERGILLSLAVLVVGSAWLLRAVWGWRQVDFGPLPSVEDNLRTLIPAATLVLLGVQGVFSSFFMSVLGLKASAPK